MLKRNQVIKILQPWICYFRCEEIGNYMNAMTDFRLFLLLITKCFCIVVCDGGYWRVRYKFYCFVKFLIFFQCRCWMMVVLERTLGRVRFRWDIVAWYCSWNFAWFFVSHQHLMLWDLLCSVIGLECSYITFWLYWRNCLLRVLLRFFKNGAWFERKA